jgi:ribosomal protein S18 acetylase RimI-like enzyme
VCSLIAASLPVAVDTPAYREPVEIRPLAPTDAEVCDAIVAGLPAWFGSDRGIRDCAEAVRSQDGLVAVADAEVVGFLTWEGRQPGVAEITWMAVRSDTRRRGVGRALLSLLAARLRDEGVTRLDVKTLSDRDPYPPYAETRAFYAANGFTKVAELDIWGPENPAVLLSRLL